jgi:predicted nucleic acid-binding protein
VIVVDTSVVVQWVAPEDGQLQAERLLGQTDLGAPDVLLVEAADVLAKKVRAGDSTLDGALAGLALIRDTVPKLVSSADLAAKAMRLSAELSHPAYDCCFRACALDVGAVLATRDRPFIVRLTEHGYADQIHVWRVGQ